MPHAERQETWQHTHVLAACDTHSTAYNIPLCTEVRRKGLQRLYGIARPRLSYTAVLPGFLLRNAGVYCSGATAHRRKKKCSPASCLAEYFIPEGLLCEVDGTRDQRRIRWVTLVVKKSSRPLSEVYRENVDVTRLRYATKG